jgi:hypothetical protein
MAKASTHAAVLGPTPGRLAALAAALWPEEEYTAIIIQMRRKDRP